MASPQRPRGLDRAAQTRDRSREAQGGEWSNDVHGNNGMRLTKVRPHFAASRPREKPNRTDLLEAWTETYGSPPPKGISTRLLNLAIAYEEQVTIHGGLSKSTRRKLTKHSVKNCASADSGIVKGVADSSRDSDPFPARRSGLPRPGTRLMREWNGKTHIVDILESGVVYEGQTYRSLSAVARAITGARWSGPRFFGLERGAL